MKESTLNPNTSEFESNLRDESLTPLRQNSPRSKNTIPQLEHKKAMYTRLIYLVAFVSATSSVIGNVNFWYLTQVLKVEINAYTFFTYYAGVLTYFKPVLSLISEIVTPFNSRIKFYIISASLMICLSSLLASVFSFGYWPFFGLNFLTSTCYAIIELVAEGLNVEVVRIDAQINLQKSRLNKNGKIEENEKKSFGNFYVISRATECIMQLVGSYFSAMINSVKPFYAF